MLGIPRIDATCFERAGYILKIHKKRFLGRPRLLNFDRNLNSLFGLKITVALSAFNKTVFILSADHLNKF
jgi:hypothetical protein